MARIVRLALVFATCGLVALPALADDWPPLPFITKDICPADHCAFGSWVAARPMVAYASEGNTRTTAFFLAPGERFMAIGGNLHTLKPGKAQIMESFTDPPGSKNPNDKFAKDTYMFLLAPRGEDFYEVWYHNRRRGVKLAMADNRYYMPGRDLVKLLEPATWTWWVFIKNKQGQKGWLSFPGIVTGEVKGLDPKR
jgi:hypothetical protein